MSATAKVEQIGKTKQQTVEPGQAYIFGKINSAQKFQTKDKRTMYRTRVLMKDASDDFSYPMPFDILTDQSIGQKGDIYEGIVNLKTFRGDWDTRPDPETGEIKRIQKVELTCYMPVL